nr:hypothetical protein [Tanacetum cinerariifolium]
MFLTHSNEALEIEKFKRARENKIKFAYDYGILNQSYVNEKINFSNDYFQEIINPDFGKNDSLFQQTSSLIPYVPTVILEKIIIDLEDEVVSLLEKEKANFETIESLKSTGFESSENAISESENQSENDCQVVEKECYKVVNSKVIAPGMFKLSVSQSVSQVSMSKTSCDSKNVENKTKRKRLPTPIFKQAKLKLDLVGKPVDHTDYRSMIGSLMYVTSSRPDIMFATCLWYLKDYGFDLTAYSDADHAGCHLDRKTESEYVAVFSCCAQVLWMRTQLTDYGFFYDKAKVDAAGYCCQIVLLRRMMLLSQVKTVSAAAQ